jgi:hypothetical protein
MADFILLMHADATADEADWEPYLAWLRAEGVFCGGSAIGDGRCARKHGTPAAPSAQLVGYIRVSADDIERAAALVAGNPVFEAGGTVEIRELPRSD